MTTETIMICACRAAGPSFERDVRPILSRFCFKCHGPDEQQRQAGLRLDIRDSAIAVADSGKSAIVPGKPDASELLRRINLPNDSDEHMPPASTKFELTAEQRDILKRWIAAGAEYRPHWAFVAPRRPVLPKVRDASWPRNGIDHFVLARLDTEGLKPSPPADRHTLVRRVFLDLIGLPPTPAETDEFVSDPSPDAYERLVDRLLASPAYGERWARRWLDLARYADTNGYEKDRPRSMWPYRDWVINAINSDMPFDQFSIEQLAGDMLPNATLDQRIATGFHRNTMINEEGGIDPLEFRFHAMTDRVSTTGSVWLGLTIQCAQCHTHKYDPISQSDYYRFFALLNNADEPELDLPDADVLARQGEQDRRVAEAESELLNRLSMDEKFAMKFDAWLTRAETSIVNWTPLRPIAATSNLPLLTIEDDGSIFASGDMSKSDLYEVALADAPRGMTAIRLEPLPDDRLPKHGPGRVYYEGPHGDFFLSDIELVFPPLQKGGPGEVTPDELDAKSQSGATPPSPPFGRGGKAIRFARAANSFASGNSTAAAALDDNKQTGWSINGGQGQRHVAVFQLAEPFANGGAIQVRMLFERYYAAGIGRVRISATSDPNAIESPLAPMDVEAALRVAREKRTAEESDRLKRQFISVAEEFAKERKPLDELRKQRPSLPTTLVMHERPATNPRPTHRHHRGEFLQPKEAVAAGTPTFLPGLPRDSQPNRLALAQWMVSPENPLTARVAVNRQWAALFGNGLVRTVEDFGFQGVLPTHAALLDWLATDFAGVERRETRVESTDKEAQTSQLWTVNSQPSWSLKRLHRLIVTSATYQQSSRVTPELLQRDAANELLARGPRFRLEAELVRDAILSASGLLGRKLGGASVFPPQPANITTEGAYGQLAWKVSEGLDRHRRSLYTFAKRTAPFAMFTTFDAPSGEACVCRREVSNTPLQALTLLNDGIFTGASQALGREFADGAGPMAAGSDDERIANLFQRCLTRPPTSSELTLLKQFLNAQRQRLAANELDAAKLAGSSDGSVVERAAWTLVARALLNLDEAVTKN